MRKQPCQKTPQKTSLVAGVAFWAIACFGPVVGPATAAPSVDLSWLDTSTNEEFWSVQRSIDGGDFEPYRSFVSDTGPARNMRVQWSDLDVEAGRVYAYRVRAGNTFGYSDFSDAAAMQVPGLPNGAPGDLSAQLAQPPAVVLRLEVLGNGQVNVLPAASE